MCFHKFSEKSSKLTHDLATDKLKTYPKIVKKSLQKVCKKSAKSQQKKSAYSKVATTSLQK